MRYTSCVDLHIVLRDPDGRIALGRRRNTGWMDGHHHLPSGHLEDGESAREGAARELEEETGVLVPPDGLTLVHTMHHRTDAGRVALFFTVPRAPWTLGNPEPDKCDGWAWYPPTALPGPIVPYTAGALVHIAARRPYSEQGWQ
ncbi:NUDIX hydrolase [Streptomyces yaizuensis]|uniref:NUDIX domain-containing protein n=1 Tax=Streptomyces yaizuensis TaxID=2989713 RepID=A0ABQ5NQS7_9ACTN|nr:NUDIX domain-containing protein [Streptomyces sp. YSPA8]GLF92716.1 NUDIX domain-containing protein [Streptomyces sp. YSPA8]